MTIDRQQLAPYTPVAIAIAILVFGWVAFIRPLSAESARDARTLTQLRQRATGVRNSLSQPVPSPDVVNPVDVFRGEVPAHDAVPALMEQLARLASSVAASNLMIETGERAEVASATAAGPQVAGATAAQPDPRLALFETPLAYVPITMSIDGDYARLGNLLWHLRDVATLVEIRSLEVKPLADRPPATLHATLTLFAYGRRDAGRGPAVVTASNGPRVTR